MKNQKLGLLTKFIGVLMLEKVKKLGALVVGGITEQNLKKKNILKYIYFSTLMNRI